MLINADGEKLGSFELEESLNMAQKDNLDLVQVSPVGSETVVCKIMDYGKHIFAKKKAPHHLNLKLKEDQ